MNTFTALFGIFRQKGLVTTLQANESPFRFIVWSIVISVLSGMLYGLGMGIGLGLETALKDASKLGLIMLLSVILAVPIFWIAYRLLGREESLAQVVVVPVTLVTTVAIILAVTAPIVFMLSILSGYSADAVYIHVVIVDLAILIGLYLVGMLLYHGFTGHRRLIYTATAVNAAAQEVTLRLDATTFRLLSLTLGSTERGLHGQSRLDEIEASMLDRAALESSFPGE